jgi:hypothetical protein
MLTVIGFSVHDTIVVFDRVRENRSRHAGEPFDRIVNHSILQTFGRSITTSLTVVITLLSLLLFAGDAIGTFVLALLIGIVSGTYSSIFNASRSREPGTPGTPGRREAGRMTRRTASDRDRPRSAGALDMPAGSGPAADWPSGPAEDDVSRGAATDATMPDACPRGRWTFRSCRDPCLARRRLAWPAGVSRSSSGGLDVGGLDAFLAPPETGFTIQVPA